MAIEIRLHGRGGQGGVTCAKLIAAVYVRLGKSVQTFGDYAGERSGAPVRAYTRVSDTPITNRNKVYHPDHVLVLDPTLLGAEAVSGLAPGGMLLINTREPLEAYDGRFDEFRLAVGDMTEIARRHGIGSRSLVIVNTTIAGAFVRVMDIPFEALEETYQRLGFASNLPAAREAWESVSSRLPRAEHVERPVEAAPAEREVLPLTEQTESPAPLLKTGSWRTQRPEYSEELAPCNAFCPAGNDVVGFIQAGAREGDQAAAAVLRRTQPLASVCGRVCPAPCMDGCNRHDYDGAVNIRGLERWYGDNAPLQAADVPRTDKPRSIGIIGGGPAGLSAAYRLASAGHKPVIYEGEASLGGVLRTGIPSYRLPRESLDREIDMILKLGVEKHCGWFLAPVDLERLAREHDALILATGLQRLRGLEAKGSDLPGVEQGIKFLHRVNMGETPQISGRVMVLGGGNTALDCARSALRAGASEVTIAYRRTRLEMPAIKEEIHEAEEEGIRLLVQRQPVGFVGNGRVSAVELAEVEMGEPDETGRRRPIVTGRHHLIHCDHVLLALGQSADLGLLPESWQLDDGWVSANGKQLTVFAAGDVSTGDGTVTHAIGDGRRAAERALVALGEQLSVFERPDRSLAVPATDIRFDHFARSTPDRDQLLPAAERAGGFMEANRGLKTPAEAHRCFSCGHCTECDTCLVYCPEGIIRRHGEQRYEVDYSYCKGCGICVTECPRQAIQMVAE